MPTVETDTITIPADTVAGTHVLIARLHGADHLILEPEVTEEVEIEVVDATGSTTGSTR